jgi:hypothetical protein
MEIMTDYELHRFVQPYSVRCHLSHYAPQLSPGAEA